MAAMRKEVEEVLIAIKNPPAFDPSLQPDADPVQEFERILKEYQRHIMDWRSNILKAVAKLEIVFKMGAEIGEDALRIVVEEIMPPIKTALFAAIEEAENKVLIDDETKRNLDFSVWADPSLAPAIQAVTRSLYRAANIYVLGLTDIRDRVQMLEWDYDPDARGGATFDNADDLLASLGA